MFGKILARLDTILTFFEEWTLFVAVFVALISLFVSVVLRYAFSYTLAWPDELVRHVIIYTTLIGCSLAVRRRMMIKIDASIQLLPRLKTFLTYFSNFTILIFSIWMIYYGFLMAKMQVQTFQKTIIMEIPYVYLYSLLPLMGVLMLLRIIQIFYEDTTKLLAKAR